MIRVTKLFVLIIFSFSTFNSLSAQNSGDIDLGGGITYGLDLEEIGIQAVSNYSLNDRVRVGADFIFWLSENENEFVDSFSSTLFEINGNIHYLFYTNGEFSIYAMGSLGLHYASVSIDDPSSGSDSSSETELGLGFGAGAEYNLGPVKIYVEPRFFISGFDQLALSAGFKVPLNR